MGSQEAQSVCIYHRDLSGCWDSEGTLTCSQVLRKELKGFLDVKGKDLNLLGGHFECFFPYLEEKHIQVEKHSLSPRSCVKMQKDVEGGGDFQKGQRKQRGRPLRELGWRESSASASP